jgi:hypothetical protein
MLVGKRTEDYYRDLYKTPESMNEQMHLPSCLVFFFADEIEVRADAEGIDQHSDHVP